MKHAIVFFSMLCAIANLNGTIAAAEATVLHEKLMPLEPYLGTWNICWTDRTGQHRSGTASLAPAAGGSIVLFHAQTFDKDGRPSFSRVSVFFWNAASQSIAESNFDSTGGHGLETLSHINAKKWVWEGRGRNGAGNEGARLTEMIHVNPNKWTVQFKGRQREGIELPDSPKFTFTRSERSEPSPCD